MRSVYAVLGILMFGMAFTILTQDLFDAVGPIKVIPVGAFVGLGFIFFVEWIRSSNRQPSLGQQQDDYKRRLREMREGKKIE